MQYTGSELVAAGAVGALVGVFATYCWVFFSEVRQRRARYQAKKWNPQQRAI